MNSLKKDLIDSIKPLPSVDVALQSMLIMYTNVFTEAMKSSQQPSQRVIIDSCLVYYIKEFFVSYESHKNLDIANEVAMEKAIAYINNLEVKEIGPNSPKN